MGTVPPPEYGLGSNANYFLYSGGDVVKDISVTLEITDDIVSNIGFTFQLNAWTPKDAKNCSWQQYGFDISGSGAATTIGYFIDNWPVAGFDHLTGDLINHFSPTPLLTLAPRDAASGPTLPAKFKLTVELKNDSAGNITAVTCSVVDPDGNTASSGAVQLVGLPVSHHPKDPIKPDDLAPVTALSLNFVGPPTSREAYLRSGAGTITYSASTPLTVLSTIPADDVQAPGCFTAEEANSVYGELAAGPFRPGDAITQTFGTVEPPAYAPGGPIAVSQQIGLDRTNLYVVNKEGQLAVFSVDGRGHWSSSQPIGPSGQFRRAAWVVASERFGANKETDVFLISQHGQLNVFSSGDGETWSGPELIGEGGTTPAGGASLAVSQRFGVPGQTDLFFVDNKGTLNVFSSDGTAAWKGPASISQADIFPSGAPLAASRRFGASDQTDVFMVDKQGALNVFSAQGSADWAGPKVIAPAGAFPPNAFIAASRRFDASDETLVFAVDNNGQLVVYGNDGKTDWSGPSPIGAKGLAVPGAPVAVSQRFGVPDQTDVFVVDKTGTLKVFSARREGTWCDASQIGPAGVAPTEDQMSNIQHGIADHQSGRPHAAFVAASAQFGASNQTDVFVLNETGKKAPGWPTVLWFDSSAQGNGDWFGPKALVDEV